MSVARALPLVLVAGLGFGATAAFVRRLVPWPEEYGLAAKLRWWDEHADEHDVVFVGSSRVFRAFDPRAFEAELATQGRELRAFNLGVGGVRPFEMDLILRAVLEREPKRLRWVLYEGGPMDPRFEPLDDVESSRMVFWHTPERTRDVLHSIAVWPIAESDARQWGEKHPWIAPALDGAGLFEPAWRADLARRHVQILAWNVASFGQGRAILGEVLGEELTANRRRMLSPEELDQGRGFVAFEDNADEKDAERHRLLVANPAGFAQRVEEVRAGNELLPDVATLNLPALAAQQALVRAAGAEMVYVVLPDRLPRPDRRALQRAGKLDDLFDFNQPDRWPQFFTVESRYDAGHLSGAGAREFSRALAREFAALAEAKDARGR
ncbi:MAG: hypothetical protein IPJ77_14755 [Planctomycetes bacterium]|nr:hypothetical protein [Planctomycetota bacterium]